MCPFPLSAPNKYYLTLRHGLSLLASCIIHSINDYIWVGAKALNKQVTNPSSRRNQWGTINQSIMNEWKISSLPLVWLLFLSIHTFIIVVYSINPFIILHYSICHSIHWCWIGLSWWHGVCCVLSLFRLVSSLCIYLFLLLSLIGQQFRRIYFWSGKCFFPVTMK